MKFAYGSSDFHAKFSPENIDELGQLIKRSGMYSGLIYPPITTITQA
ncbi:MAG: hypothetical protein HQK65_00815 [Desulfamplus sp.]|nr:hypothetical protein [Desulfamplus sp.]